MPEIGQHPSGRGKMGYYPDHALALVRRIVALKKEGQPLKQAASQRVSAMRCDQAGAV